MAKTVNYSADLTNAIIAQYEAGVSVESIAADIDKSVRSVRSKLVREGVYVAKPKTTSRKKDEPTKKELINHLETIAPFGVDGFMGATKEAINELIKHLEAQ